MSCMNHTHKHWTLSTVLGIEMSSFQVRRNRLGAFQLLMGRLSFLNNCLKQSSEADVGGFDG